MKKAFTLIELIIVIGIIAILSATLIVSLSGSSDSAKAAKCLANMHALAMGVQGRAVAGSNALLAGSITKYTSARMDNTTTLHGWIGWNGTSYISPYSEDDDAREKTLKNGSIWSYVSGNKDVYFCPLHRKAAEDASVGLKYGPLWSYAMNAKFGWMNQTDPYSYKYCGRDFVSLADKNKILLFAELPFTKNAIVSKPDFNSGASKANDPILQYSGNGGDELIGFNHKLGKREMYGHVCFADGHTEKFQLPRNATEQNIKELTKWLCDPSSSNDIVLENGKYQQLGTTDE